MKISSAFLLGTKIKAAEPTPPPVSGDWEILFEWYFPNGAGLAYINSNFEALGDRGLFDQRTIDGDLIKFEETGGNQVPPVITAKQSIVARTMNANTANAYANYLADDVILSSNPNYEWAVIAKSSAATDTPFELCFAWRWGASMQGFVVKSDGTMIPWSQRGTYGDYLAVGIFTMSWLAFSGTLKYFKVGSDSAEQYEWITLDPSTAGSVSISDSGTYIFFAIPNS